MYLLDTHIIYWALRESENLPEKVRHILEEEECCISVISLWEMAIKSALGKLELNRNCRQIADAFCEIGIQVIGVTPDDCDMVKNLPAIHKDPFDRMLIAQAVRGGFTIVTRDRAIPEYNVKTVWE